jgi:DNA-binding CsgD family transcriptional regulator
MGKFEMQKIGSVAIRSSDDILPCAENFRDIAGGYGLRVLAWHNLGSPMPMRSEDGELLCTQVFGWTGEKEWWHSLAKRKYSPLADLCRYQTEPFWGNSDSGPQSRHPTPYADKIDFEYVWENSEARSIMVIPVHMQMGQVGLVGFVSASEDIEFEDCVDHLSWLSHSFLSSYVRTNTVAKRARVYKQLSTREIDCLSWALDGKTDRDIAEITGRSYATVRFYISSAAEKLGTVNRAQTLAKAATLGYFAAYA